MYVFLDTDVSISLDIADFITFSKCKGPANTSVWPVCKEILKLGKRKKFVVLTKKILTVKND